MRLTIKTSLIGILVALTCVMAIQGWLSIDSLSAINDNVVMEATNRVPSVDVIHKINSTASDIRIAESYEVMTTSEDVLNSAELEISKYLKQMADLRQKYQSFISSTEEQNAYDRFSKKFDDYLTMHKALVDFARKYDYQHAGDLFQQKMRKAFDSFGDDLDADIKINNDGAQNDYEKATITYANARFRLIAFVFGGSLLGLIAIGVVIKTVTSPIARITTTMQLLSSGQLQTEIPFARTQNEVGRMARALAVFRDGLLETASLREQAANTETANAEAALQARKAIADQFQARMGALTDSLAKSSREVADAAKSLSGSAEETSHQAQAASGAAEEAAANVQTVAAATEEMAASIREIASQVSRSSAVANVAAEEASRTESDVRSLAEAASKIGEVVDLINNIASQTNLLALNATIEAARAGEAGRGFAVVASEVKQLASETAKATEEIGTKVAEIQSATTRTVGSIDKIVNTVGQIQSIASVIASAIEEQGAATGEISSNTQRASNGTQVVTHNIVGVGQAAEMTGAASSQLMGLSGNLSSQASDLQKEVSAFVRQLRAG